MSNPDLKKMARAIASTRPDEIDCGACFERLGRYVELARSGEPVEDLMPRVARHLKRCADCREECKALMDALNEIE